MEKILYMFVIPVWGETHIRLFLDICIPSMLAEGNLPYMILHADVRFILYVRDSEEEKIKAHPSIQKLCSIVDVEFRHIKFIRGRDNHAILSDCHRDGLKEACAKLAYAILPPPDSVWSNNSFSSMHKLVLDGIKVIHMACLRLQLELAYPVITGLAGNDIISIAPMDLVKLSMNRLHGITKTHIINHYAGGLMPANLLWRVADAGLLAHCFHLHPILIMPTESNLDFKVTIDDDLLMGDAYAPEEIHIVQDSDEMLAYEISSRMHFVGTTGAKDDIDAIVRWAYVGTNEVHRKLVSTPIYIHHKPLDLTAWATMSGQAEQFVTETLEKLSTYEGEEASISGIWRLYGNIYRLIRSIDSLVLGPPLRLRRSHWMYLLEDKIYKPVAKEINNTPGIKCFVDDDRKIMHQYLHSSFDVFCNTYITREELLYNSDDLEQCVKFDTIICRVNAVDPDIQLVVDKAAQFVTEQGQIILYCFGEMSPEMPASKYNLKIINVSNVGGLGCRTALRLHNRFSMVIGVGLKKMMAYNVVGVIAKTMLRILFVPVKIILYPLFGMLLMALEFLSPAVLVNK